MIYIIINLKAQDVRPDGRQFLSFRPISVNISSITHADSSAIFKIGNTTIVCGIKAVSIFHFYILFVYINKNKQNQPVKE